MDPKAFLANVSAHWRRPTLDPKSFDSIAFKTPISPSEYLAFAEKDFRLGGTRGFVNALANSKRAIDCQIHVVLEGLGLPARGDFPKKLESIGALGLVAPRILRKTVQLRNRLEHDFHRPGEDEVENAVDVATLFLETLRPLVAGSYMSSGWIADAVTANHVPLERNGSIISWDRRKSPKYTFASGIYVESDLKTHTIHLDFVDGNVLVTQALMSRFHSLYAPMQAYLLRCRADNPRYHSSRGARDFLKLMAAWN